MRLTSNQLNALREVEQCGVLTSRYGFPRNTLESLVKHGLCKLERKTPRRVVVSLSPAGKEVLKKWR